MDLTPPQLSPEPATNSLSPSALDPPSPPLPPQSNPRRPRRTFVGPFGLRAGWSLLLYFAILGAIAGGIFAIGHVVHVHRDHAAAAAALKAGKPAPPPSKSFFANRDGKKPQPVSALILGEGIAFLLYLLVSWLMALIERRKLSSYGLGGAHPIRRLLVGAFWGIAAISLLVLALHSFHLLTFDVRLDHGPSVVYFGALLLFGFLLVGLLEEYSFRGYIQFTLTRGLVSLGNRISPPHARTIAFWIASFLTSAIFLAAHTQNNGENALGLFQVFLAGVLFVVALWRTGALWWGIGFHMAWDWGQSFLYGVPDSGLLTQGRLFSTHANGNPLFSGGTVGPEGSVLCIPIFLLAIAVLFFTHPSPQPPLELPSAPSHPDPQLSPFAQDLPDTSSAPA